MQWHILTWNPVNFQMDWDEIATVVDEPVASWSTGAHKTTIAEGDGLFFLMQGAGERGIIAHGIATSDIFQDAHWDGEAGHIGNYVLTEWAERTTIAGRLTTQTLLAEVPGVKWDYILGSGLRIDEADADKILELWNELPSVWISEPDPVETPAVQSAIRKKAIEEYAEFVVLEHLTALGYEPTLVGDTESWDITAIRDEVELHIEVKGSSTKREKVSLTRNEVNHSRDHETTALAVVDQIDVTAEYDCSGGHLRVWQLWSASEGDLSASAYDYDLPAGHANDFT